MGCTSVPRDLWEDYRDRTLYARYDVPVTPGGVVDIRGGVPSGEFIPLGSAVTVGELTGDHLALLWGKRMVFLLEPDRAGIEGLFSRDPPGSGSDAVRDRGREAPLAPDPYPALDPRRKRPYRPW